MLHSVSVRSRKRMYFTDSVKDLNSSMVLEGAPPSFQHTSNWVFPRRMQRKEKLSSNFLQAPLSPLYLAAERYFIYLLSLIAIFLSIAWCPFTKVEELAPTLWTVVRGKHHQRTAGARSIHCPELHANTITEGPVFDLMQAAMNQYLTFRSLNWTMPAAMINPSICKQPTIFSTYAIYPDGITASIPESHVILLGPHWGALLPRGPCQCDV